MSSAPVIRLCRPGKQPPTGDLKGNVVVLDLALRGENPQLDVNWANRLGSRLLAWVDHHDQNIWASLQNDQRFVLRPRSQAPACPPLIDRELVKERGAADTILCHGDLDGVLSAAKWWILQDGGNPPDWLDPDSVVADTRTGTFTKTGKFLDHALRGGNDHIRRLVIRFAYAQAMSANFGNNNLAKLEMAAEQHHQAVNNSLGQLKKAIPLDDLEGSVVFLDLLTAQGRIDITEILLSLQREYDLVILRARGKQKSIKWVVGTDPVRSGLDVRKIFGLQGFAPFRAHVTTSQLQARLPSKYLPLS